MNDDQAKRLRAPFDAAQIGWLPKLTCAACAKRQCSHHQREHCDKCQSRISTAHIDLEYVGHAAVTDRLLQVDPEWTWEPVAFAADGLPQMDRHGGLWIRLTVAGVTRYGYGAADGKTGPDAVKEAIGDAIRNAAMRFGVALDLWHKGDMHPEAHDDQTPSTKRRTDSPSWKAVDAARKLLATKCKQHGFSTARVAALFAERFDGQQISECTDASRLVDFAKSLDEIPRHRLVDDAPEEGAA